MIAVIQHELGELRARFLVSRVQCVSTLQQLQRRPVVVSARGQIRLRQESPAAKL